MPWNQIELALNERRRELCLSGKEFSAHLEEHGLDAALFDVDTLNYLAIHGTCLASVPEDVRRLRQLQTLSLHTNHISSVPVGVAHLDKLKVLDLSHNRITSIDADLDALANLATLNLSDNKLRTCPVLTKTSKLQVIDLSSNAIVDFAAICHAALANLADVKLSNNAIDCIPRDVYRLSSLKLLDVAHNRIADVPGEVALCGKLKELTLQDNPIKDRRLLKLIAQCRTKQVIDYVKQHCKIENPPPVTRNGKENKRNNQNSTSDDDLPATVTTIKHQVHVRAWSESSVRIIAEDASKPIRQHIICCLLHGIRFTPELFKSFLQLQTKLHDTLCEKRNIATIATHDALKLVDCELVYTAMKPTDLMIMPLNSDKVCSGRDLFARLQSEAENLRKEKKRNAYSGIHKYLYLLEGKPMYACLMRRTADGSTTVISFPPITNAADTKMTLSTTSLLLEVTGAGNLPLLRKIMDTLIQEAVILFPDELTVEQCKITGVDSNLKLIYPSKVDLALDPCCGIAVLRD